MDTLNPTMTPRDPDPSGLAGRLARVHQEIREACADAGRTGDEPTLIVVTKFHPASLVRELAALGVRDFGENRHPESRDKAEAVADLPGLVWHFIGQVQTKKARQIARYADALHAVDREALVDALASAERETPLDVFVQLNLTDDPGRGGVDDAGLEALCERVLETPTLRLRGLMSVAPLGGDPDRAFAHVRARSEDVRRLEPTATALSMGMSGDFRSAISQGATHLRIGMAITGNRPPRA